MEHPTASTSPIAYSSEDWFDPLEEAVRFQVRTFIEALVEEEVEGALGGRKRYQRHRTSARGVQSPDQNPMRPAQRGNGGHAVLGLDGVEADHHAPRRWLANAGPCAGPAAA